MYIYMYVYMYVCIYIYIIYIYISGALVLLKSWCTGASAVRALVLHTALVVS